MHYNSVGQTGLKVSALGIGSSQYSFTCQHDNLHTIRECVYAAFDGGINYFDTAEVYGLGLAELVWGEIFRTIPRDQVVIGTKVMFGGVKPTQKGLSRKHITDAVNQSLRRLQMDYVDILYCHGFDPETPLSETILAMDNLVRSGKTVYWATSNWSGKQIIQAVALAEELGCHPPIMEQAEYNLFRRQQVEGELKAVITQCGMGLAIYAPLAIGVLSGKYNREVPKTSRLGRHGAIPKDRYINEKRLKVAGFLQELAQELHCSPAQLGLAWCLANPQVSVAVFGASSKEQIDENIQAAALVGELTPSLMGQIDEVLGQA